MKQGLFEIINNRPLNENFFSLTFEGDCSAFTAPGQFVSVMLPGFFLRRPFSVCDWEENQFRIICEKVGQGTACLAALPVGTELDVLTGLGNGFSLENSGDVPLLVGGGSGASPLFGLAKRMLEYNLHPEILLGFAAHKELILLEEFENLGLRPLVATVDGSFGFRGLVTDLINNNYYTSFYTCGPEAMMRAVSQKCPVSGQLSFDARMGCGFGACMGCSRMTVNGPKRVCKDGPVFRKEEILWED